MNTRFLAFLLLLTCWGFSSLPVLKADGTPPVGNMGATAQKLSLIWLKSEAADLLTLLPPAPALGSPVDQDDVAQIVQAQKNLTDAQRADLTKFAKMRVSIVTEVISPKFATQFPKTFALMERVQEEAHYFSTTIKELNKRIRPYKTHKEVKAILQENGFAYPSGHATQSETLAMVLSVLFPDQADALKVRAKAIRESRVNAGVHHPSDIEAGKKLGDAIAKALLDNDDFKKEFAVAKAEVAKK